jgi:Carboxypeptidase regulatory-like domain
MRGFLRHRRTLVTGLVAVVAATAPSHAHAQQSVLTGLVQDLSGKPIPEVIVDVSGVKKHAVTDDKGRFKVEKLSADSVSVILRRVGPVPQTIEVRLVPGQNQITVTMEPVPQVLDAVRSATTQTGLFGVVGDTAFNIVPGAAVTTVVHHATTTTNEKGQFYFDPVKPGADMVDVRKLGYRPRVVSFTMPEKGGQRVAIWLTPLPTGLDERAMRRLSAPSNALMQELFDFGQRRRWASSTRSMFATREQLAQYASGMRADDALQHLPRFGTVRLDDIDCVIVDGTMAGGFLQDYSADEIETLEITALGTLSALERSHCSPSGGTGFARRQHWAALIMLRH